MALWTRWKDHATEFVNRYKEVQNTDGTITHVAVEGTVIQEGTPQNAQNFNDLEQRVVEAGQDASIALLGIKMANTQIKNSYSSPETGIPENDLAPELRELINGALQKNDEIIPDQANAGNRLATEDFVNSSIEQMAANRVTYDENGSGFPTRADLMAATVVYHGGEEYTPVVHDYALVIADESAPSPFTGGQTRMEYDGTKWVYDYGINDRPFTAAEVAVLNSGITAALTQQFKNQLADIENNKVNIVASDTNIPVESRAGQTYYLIASGSAESN